MKFLIVALSALAVASAQTTTVTTTLGVNLLGNADGSATITVGAGPGVTIPASAVTAAKAIIGLLNSAVSEVASGSNTTVTLPVTVNTATKAVSLTFGGNTYTLDQATVRQAMALKRQIFQALVGDLPRLAPGPIGGNRRGSGERHGRRGSGERRERFGRRRG